MTELKRPMLATDYDEAKLTFPLYASYKLDGIRCLITHGGAHSRSMKLIPNEFVQRELSNPDFAGLDGELVVGDPYASNCMQATSSGVMSAQGEPDFSYWVFDCWSMRLEDYQERFQVLSDWFLHSTTHHRVKLLPQVLIQNLEDLHKFENAALALGYEGIMLRKPIGLYKQGRSTVREGYLLKVKRFVDSEMTVEGAEERMHNANEAYINELGYLTRSSHAENLVPMGTLGALVGTDMITGMSVRLGTGFDADTAARLWQKHLAGELVGTIVKYKHFAQTGVKDRTRFGVYLGERDRRDM